jgi:hypothetical protein
MIPSRVNSLTGAGHPLRPYLFFVSFTAMV